MIPGIHFDWCEIDTLPNGGAESVHFKDQVLTEREHTELDCFASPNRRSDYLAGRWLAKRLILSLIEQAGIWETPLQTQPDLKQIEILSRDSNRRPTRPQVFLIGEVSNIEASGIEVSKIQISISHAAGRVLVAATREFGYGIGCDLTTPVGLNQGFEKTWFTQFECENLQANSWQTAGMIWACKEASFKALNQGEKFIPRQIEVDLTDAESGNAKFMDRRCELFFLPQEQFGSKETVGVIAWTNSMAESGAIATEVNQQIQCH